MEQEKRTVRFDSDLQIEAYRFEGIMQKFPNHFHEYYVLGFMESGRRRLWRGDMEYVINPGDLLLFNPLDNHACEQIDENPTDYRCLNISPQVMGRITADILGEACPTRFAQAVVCGSDAVPLLRELHQMVMDEHAGFEKEEALYFLIERLIWAHAGPSPKEPSGISPEVQKACGHMEKHFAEAITLENLSRISGLNKYTLIRSFTKQRGITPYRYMETLRVNAAKKMLENGAEPIDAAMRAGFADQSHFTKFFKNYIGLTPKQYRDIFRGDTGGRAQV